MIDQFLSSDEAVFCWENLTTGSSHVAIHEDKTRLSFIKTVEAAQNKILEVDSIVSPKIAVDDRIQYIRVFTAETPQTQSFQVKSTFTLAFLLNFIIIYT